MEETSKIRTLFTTKRKKLTVFYGHVMTREALKSIVVAGRISGLGGSGRQISGAGWSKTMA